MNKHFRDGKFDFHSFNLYLQGPLNGEKIHDN